MRRKIVLLFPVLFSLTILLTFTQGTASAHTKQSAAANGPCYSTVVYLHSDGSTTSVCENASKPAGITPNIASYPCGDALPYPWVSLYQNSWYGGAQICFVGTGSVNLTNYWINGSTSWNDQTSSFNMGAYGYLTTDINGNGSHCYFSPGSETYYINNICGSGWNDVVSYVNISG